MNRRLNYIILIFLFFFASFKTFCQKTTTSRDRNSIYSNVKPLRIGDKCPDFFLNKIINYNKSTARLSDFKGKWLLLDFWFIHCVPCLKLLPKTDSLQHVFGNHIQILPVTFDKEKDVKELFSNLNNGKGVNYPSVVDENGVLLTKLFPHKTYPHFVWIDPTGTVRAITDETSVTGETIKSVINGEQISLPFKNETQTQKFNHNKPLLLDSNAGGSDQLVYYSVLKKGYIDGEGTFVGNVTPDRFIVTNMPILGLYLVAYAYLENGVWNSGFPANRTVFEVKDTLRYTNWYHKMDATKNHSWEMENLYSYNLILPYDKFGYKPKYGESWSDIMFNRISAADYLEKWKQTCKIMQADLERAFGLTASIEKRKIKAYVLECTDTTSLKTSGKPTSFSSDRVYSLEMNNNTMKEFLEPFRTAFFWTPIIDETGFNGKFDVNIKTSLGDITEVNNALKKYGLKFNEEVREMKVLVISDPKQE